MIPATTLCVVHDPYTAEGLAHQCIHIHSIILLLEPSAVTELSLNVTDDQLIVTWLAPMMPNGPGPISYNVTLSGINLVDNSSITITSDVITITETMYTVAHSSLPYSIYTAAVVAFTGAGASEQRAVSEQTPEEGKNTMAMFDHSG